jgi:hypothetical protein
MTTYTKRWLLNGTAIGTGTTVLAPTAGTLVLEVTATNANGSTVSLSNPVTVTAGTVAVNSKRNIGANLTAASWFQSARCYTNLTRYGSWQRQGVSGSPVERDPARMTSEGEPLGDLPILDRTAPGSSERLFKRMSFPDVYLTTAGRQTVRCRAEWTGTGTVVMYGSGTSLSVVSTDTTSPVRSIVYDFTFDPSLARSYPDVHEVQILAQSAADPIRNLFIAECNQDGSYITRDYWHPAFVSLMSTYKEIRFLDHTAVNGYPDTVMPITWDKRPKESMAVNDGEGVHATATVGSGTSSIKATTPTSGGITAALLSSIWLTRQSAAVTPARVSTLFGGNVTSYLVIQAPNGEGSVTLDPLTMTVTVVPPATATTAKLVADFFNGQSYSTNPAKQAIGKLESSGTGPAPVTDAPVPLTGGQAPRSYGQLPLERAVELCNSTNADLYWNLPYAATNEFIANTAQYIAQNLKVGLGVTFECGNEPWNYGTFDGARFLYTDALFYDSFGARTNNFDLAKGLFARYAQLVINLNAVAKPYFTNRASDYNVAVNMQNGTNASSGSADIFGYAGMMDAFTHLATAPYYRVFNADMKPWVAGTLYAKDAVFTYNNVAYIATESHTAAAGSPPPNASSVRATASNTVRALKADIDKAIVGCTTSNNFAQSIGKRWRTYEAGNEFFTDDNALVTDLQTAEETFDVYDYYLSKFLAISPTAKFMQFGAISATSGFSFGAKRWLGESLATAPRQRAINNQLGINGLTDISLINQLPQANIPFSTTFTGKAAGSTLKVTAADGTLLTISGSTISGTFTNTGSIRVEIKEVLGDAERITYDTFFVAPGAYQAETTTLVNRMTALGSEPTMARKGSIDNLIKALKTAGVWSNLRTLVVPAAHSSLVAPIVWTNPSQSGVMGSSTLFTTDVGFTGDATVNGVVTFGEPFTAGSILTQDNALTGLWASDLTKSGVTAGSDLGSVSSGNIQVTVAKASAGGRMTSATTNQTLVGAVMPTLATHHVTRARISPTEDLTYVEGALYAKGANTSTTNLPTTNATIFGSGSSYQNHTVKAAYWGRALSPDEVTTLSAADAQTLVAQRASAIHQAFDAYLKSF